MSARPTRVSVKCTSPRRSGGSRRLGPPVVLATVAHRRLGGGLIAAFWLMHGGAGLERVPTRLWGGLPITVMLTAVGLSLGFPLAVLLALGRRPLGRASRARDDVRRDRAWRPSHRGAVCRGTRRATRVARGDRDRQAVPRPGGVAVFASAYLPRRCGRGCRSSRGSVRSGASAGPERVANAAARDPPQALRVVVPSFVSIAVGFFQDTSLVVIIGLFDLLNTARVAAQDPAVARVPHGGVRVRWGDLLCRETLMSVYGSWLERPLHRDRRAPSLMLRIIAPGLGGNYDLADDTENGRIRLCIDAGSRRTLK